MLHNYIAQQSGSRDNTLICKGSSLPNHSNYFPSLLAGNKPLRLFTQCDSLLNAEAVSMIVNITWWQRLGVLLINSLETIEL